MEKNFALISIVNSIASVINVILATDEVAATYEESYDYVIDLSERDPQPGPGWTYDAGLDSFTAPAIDYYELVVEQINELHEMLIGMLDNASQLSPEDLNSALEEGRSQVSDSFTATEGDVVDAVITYVENGE